MPFRPTAAVYSKLSTSKVWIARQFNDPYVKRRLSDPRAYRARSAFKLLEIDNQWGKFLEKPDVNVVVDLGAAPGGWSQVVAGKLGWNTDHTHHHFRGGALGYGENFKKDADRLGTWSTAKKTADGKEKKDPTDTFDPLNIDNEVDAVAGTGRGLIIALDLLRMRAIHGVHTLQADFLSPEAEVMIQGIMEANGYIDGKVDIVLSDVAANLTGNETHDTEASLDVCHAVFEFAQRRLRSSRDIGRARGGVLLMKHFAHPLLQKFRTDVLHPNFSDVRYIKPESSRAESREGYFLCQGWKGNQEKSNLARDLDSHS